MAELNNQNVLTLNFNLRKPRSKRLTNVYAVIKVSGKQIKIPTTAKIKAYLWDSKKQTPMLLNDMSEIERTNAKHVLSIIFAFQTAFSEIYSYICESIANISSDEVRGYFEKQVLIKLYAKRRMKNIEENKTKKQRKATKALLKALNLYQSMSDKPVTDSTLKTYNYNLQNFIVFCEEVGKDSISMLTEKGLNDYEIYLRSKGKSANNIRNSLRIVRILINDVIVKHPDFKTYGIKSVNISLPKNIRSEGKKVELYDDEIKAIEKCEGLTPTQKEYRDLFVLECLTGQRASDIPILFTPSRYSVKDNYFSFVTLKEGVPALVERTPEVIAIIERYKDGFKYIDVDSAILAKNETICLKLIAEKAGLNRMISFTDVKGKRQTKALKEVISSHYGRHTFITRMARKVPLETLKFLTGHKDTQALQKYYLHQTEDDRIDLVNKALNGENASIEEKHINNVLNDQFAYDSLIHIDRLLSQNIDAFHLESTQNAIKIIKDVSTLGKSSKDIDIEKVISLEKIVFELAYYFEDVQLYSIFQYKERYYGITEKVYSNDEVEQLFRMEDVERPRRKLQLDIEEWEREHGLD